MLKNTHGGANRNQGAKKKRKSTDQKWTYFASAEIQQAFNDLPEKPTKQKFIDEAMKKELKILLK